MAGGLNDTLKKARTVAAELHAVRSITDLFEFCDLREISFEECLDVAEARWLAKVDPEGEKLSVDGCQLSDGNTDN